MKTFLRKNICILLLIGLLFATGCSVQNESETSSYHVIEVDGGDLSGHREAEVKVDIGYGEREYWAYTNAYGQLVRVEAEKITLQNEKKEKVLSTGRYYKDEAKVPGVERPDLDEGHVIADSLGGVSNAYNITPQDSTLNRHGDQAYMEKVIREAGGCENFVAEISYPNHTTQIPSHYKYTYKLKGEWIVDEFDNVNPDKVNATLNEDISGIDTNGNGVVSIAEAKKAGFKMPIKKDHWLYKYMIDENNNGMVGE